VGEHSKKIYNLSKILGEHMSKVWFITGCSKGFGRQLALELLKTTDAKVVATARNPETLKDIQSQYRDRLLVLKLDVTQPHDIKTSVADALKTFSKIDVLVNNAGYGLGGTLEECSMQDIRKIFDTNVFGLMELTKEILPFMRAQRSGYILNLSSVAGLVAMPGIGIYNSTKFAVEGLSEALSGELEHFGIKVILIEPGPFRTDFAGESLVMSSEHPAYQDNASAQIRQYLTQMNNNQPGDPVKAAQIMIKLVTMKNPPLRILLGNIAMERIHKKLKAQTEEFAQYEDLARSADYDVNVA
jgi:short-subunit dehydrogenase